MFLEIPLDDGMSTTRLAAATADLAALNADGVGDSIPGVPRPLRARTMKLVLGNMLSANVACLLAAREAAATGSSSPPRASAACAATKAICCRYSAGLNPNPAMEPSSSAAEPTACCTAP